MLYEGLEANERSNKAALLLAHERYSAQFAPFIKGQFARLSYVEDQIAAMLERCASETNADFDYVAERFGNFLRESVPSAIPADSIGIKNDTPSDLDEFTKTDVMDRGEVPGLGRAETLDVEKQDLGSDSQGEGDKQQTVSCVRCNQRTAMTDSAVCTSCAVQLRMKAAYGDDLAFTGDDMDEMYGPNGPDDDDVGALFHMWDKDMGSRAEDLKRQISQAEQDGAHPEELEHMYAELGRLMHGIDKQPPSQDFQPPDRGGEDLDPGGEAGDPYEHEERSLRQFDARKKEADLGFGDTSQQDNGYGTGMDQHDPSAQGLMAPQDANMPYTCTICGRTGTQQEVTQHVMTDHADVMQRQQQQQQGQGLQTQQPQLQQPQLASDKTADVDTQVDQDAAKVEPLNESPGDHFQDIVSDLAQRAAARHFSLPSEEQIQSIASQLGVPADEVRNSLVSIATFGNYVGQNGELGGEGNAPEGYEAISVQGVGNDQHSAVVPTDLVVTKVAEDMNMDQDLAYNMIRDKYGADLPEQYHAQVQGQQQFYLPSELAQNQQAQQQQAPAQDPNVGPAFPQTPPGAPVPQAQPSQAVPPQQ